MDVIAALLIVAIIAAANGGSAFRSFLVGGGSSRSTNVASTGSIFVRSRPMVDESVFIDGSYAGQPRERLTVRPGRHRVDLQGGGENFVPQFVDVAAGQGVTVYMQGSSAPLPRPRPEVARRRTLLAPPFGSSIPMPVQAGDRLLVTSSGRFRALLPGREVELAAGQSTLQSSMQGVLRVTSLEPYVVSVIVDVVRSDPR